MVFVRDEGSVFDAPLAVVWDYFRSGKEHSDAHRHREVERQRVSENSGRYAWTQDFLGRPSRFVMQWTSFAPLGLGYEVLEGPFSGSRFFLVYEPMGAKTGVAVVGEFTSRTISADRLAAAVDLFFSTEFEQDGAAIQKRMGRP